MPKYFREVNKHFSGDKTLAMQYMGVARSLLGGLKEMSANLYQNTRHVTLPDGAKITVWFSGEIARVAINVMGVAEKILDGMRMIILRKPKYYDPNTTNNRKTLGKDTLISEGSGCSLCDIDIDYIEYGNLDWRSSDGTLCITLDRLPQAIDNYYSEPNVRYGGFVHRQPSATPPYYTYHQSFRDGVYSNGIEIAHLDLVCGAAMYADHLIAIQCDYISVIGYLRYTVFSRGRGDTGFNIIGQRDILLEIGVDISSQGYVPFRSDGAEATALVCKLDNSARLLRFIFSTTNGAVDVQINEETIPGFGDGSIITVIGCDYVSNELKLLMKKVSSTHTTGSFLSGGVCVQAIGDFVSGSSITQRTALLAGGNEVLYRLYVATTINTLQESPCQWLTTHTVHNEGFTSVLSADIRAEVYVYECFIGEDTLSIFINGISLSSATIPWINVVAINQALSEDREGIIFISIDYHNTVTGELVFFRNYVFTQCNGTLKDVSSVFSGYAYTTDYTPIPNNGSRHQHQLAFKLGYI